MFKKIAFFVIVCFIVTSMVACTNDKEAKTDINVTEQSDNIKNNSEEKPKSEAEVASELVLATTKVVEIFSINQRLNDNYKDLGPFYFIRGVDEKGRKTEVWVNKGKIYDIN